MSSSQDQVSGTPGSALSLVEEVLPKDEQILMAFLDIIDVSDTFWNKFKDKFRKTYADYAKARNNANLVLQELRRKIDALSTATETEGSIVFQSQTAIDAVIGLNLDYVADFQMGFERSVAMGLSKPFLGKATSQLKSLKEKMEKVIVRIDGYLSKGFGVTEIDVSGYNVTIETDFIGASEQVAEHTEDLADFCRDSHSNVAKLTTDKEKVEARLVSASGDEATTLTAQLNEINSELESANATELMSKQALHFFHSADWNGAYEDFVENYGMGFGDRELSIQATKGDKWEGDIKKLQRYCINIGVVVGIIKIACTKAENKLSRRQDQYVAATTTLIQNRKVITELDAKGAQRTTEEDTRLHTLSAGIASQEEEIRGMDITSAQSELAILKNTYDNLFYQYTTMRKQVWGNPDEYIGWAHVEGKKGPLTVLFDDTTYLLKEILYFVSSFQEVGSLLLMYDQKLNKEEELEGGIASANEILASKVVIEDDVSTSGKTVELTQKTLDTLLAQYTQFQEAGNAKLAAKTHDAIQNLTQKMSENIDKPAEQLQAELRSLDRHLETTYAIMTEIRNIYSQVELENQFLYDSSVNHANAIVSLAEKTVASALLSEKPVEEKLQKHNTKLLEIQQALTTSHTRFQSAKGIAFVEDLKIVQAKKGQAKAKLNELKKTFCDPMQSKEKERKYNKYSNLIDEALALSHTKLKKAHDIISKKKKKSVSTKLDKLIEGLDELLRISIGQSQTKVAVVDASQFDKAVPLHKQKTKPAQLFTSYTTPHVLNKDNDVSIAYSYTMFSAEIATSALNILKAQKKKNWTRNRNLNSEIGELEKLIKNNGNISHILLEQSIRDSFIGPKKDMINRILRGDTPNMDVINQLISDLQEEIQDYIAQTVVGARAMSNANVAVNKKKQIAGAKMLLELGLIATRLALSQGTDIVAWYKFVKLLIDFILYLIEQLKSLNVRLSAVASEMMKLQQRIMTDTKTWLPDFVIGISGSLSETNKQFEELQAHLFSANADFLQYQLELDRMLEHSAQLKASIMKGPNELNLEDDDGETPREIKLNKRDVISSLASIEDSVQKAISKAAPLSEIIQRSREMCNKVNRDLISYKKFLNRWTINNAMGDYLLESPDSAAMSGILAAGSIGLGIYTTVDLAVTGEYITDLQGVADSFISGVGQVTEFFA